METFRELALQCGESEAADIDTALIMDIIGDIKISELGSEVLGGLFSTLYDSKGIKGRVYGKYRSYVSRILSFCEENGIVASAPKIPQRSGSKPYRFNKPDAELLSQYLSRNGTGTISTIIQLSWRCGLKRKEISSLKWEQLDPDARQLVLDDRCVPLTPEVYDYLQTLRYDGVASDYILISPSGQSPVEEHNISVIMRRALNDMGQPSVRLSDLRFDYIVRLLDTSDWKYVSYTAGIDLASLHQHFLPYVEKNTLRITKKSELTSEEAQRLEAIIHAEGGSLAGIALRFISQMGIPAALLPELNWELIDFNAALMRFSDRTIQIPSDTLAVLSQALELRQSKSGCIFINDCGKPLDLPCLIRLISKVLVRNGLVSVNVAGLCSYYWKSNPEAILSYKEQNSLKPALEGRSAPLAFPPVYSLPDNDELVRRVLLRGCLKLSDVAAEFGLSKGDAKKVLDRCRAGGQLELIGAKYYPSGCVVPSALHKEVITSHLISNQAASAGELARRLGLSDTRQIQPILKALIREGCIIKTEGGKYCLNQ